MNKLLIGCLLFLFSCSLGLDLWMTIDPSQERQIRQIIPKYFPNSNLEIFYWDNALKEISSRLKKGQKPDILLTGHTYIPFIINLHSKFDFVEPIFLDIRALYVWGTQAKVPVSRWRDMIYFLQNHKNFMSFPKNWTTNNLYNYLSFFNDQLPFWVSQSPFSTQNMVYTVRLLTKLQDNYPSLFKDNPAQSFLEKKNLAIISGIWMYNLLKQQSDPFQVFNVPRSQNQIQGFKGAFVAIYFDRSNESNQAKKILNDYNFQKEAWTAINLLPTNKQLKQELIKEPALKNLYEIADSSPWVTSIDPLKLQERVDVLNFLLVRYKEIQPFDEAKISKYFNNRLYFKLIKLLN